MRAVWYERQGPAARYSRSASCQIPSPGPVRCGCAQLLGDESGRYQETPRMAGIGDAVPAGDPAQRRRRDSRSVGDGVDPADRTACLGVRRPVVPAVRYRGAVRRPPGERRSSYPAGFPMRSGACLGIPGITAHRAVFADGPVDGMTVLVHGVLGGVGSLAAQLARRDGATVIGTVRRVSDFTRILRSAKPGR